MEDFKIVFDGEVHSCTKCDKLYVELDSSTEINDIDCTCLNKLIDSFSIPVELISCTMCIKKKNHNYKRMRKFFKKLIKDSKQNEN